MVNGGSQIPPTTAQWHPPQPLRLRLRHVSSVPVPRGRISRHCLCIGHFASTSAVSLTAHTPLPPKRPQTVPRATAPDGPALPNSSSRERAMKAVAAGCAAQRSTR